MKTDRNVEVKAVSNGNASHTEIDLSRQSPGQMTDVSIHVNLKIALLTLISKSDIVFNLFLKNSLWNITL